MSVFILNASLQIIKLLVNEKGIKEEKKKQKEKSCVSHSL